MRFILLILLLLLNACAHKTAVNPPPVKSSIVGEEYFQYPEKNSGENLSEEDSKKNSREARSCEDNQLIFLMTHPVQSMESIKNYYDYSVAYNSEMGSILDYYTAYLLGSIKIDEVREEESRVSQSIESLEYLMAKNQAYIEKVKQLIQVYYVPCYLRIKKVYSEPKYLVHGETCTLSQNQVYIEDPFRVRESASKGITSEIKIRQVFFQIMAMISEEEKKHSLNTEVLDKIEKYRQEIKTKRLIEDSIADREAFNLAYNLTMGYKKGCEDSAKKRSKIKK